jgi:hypothetical protein
MGFPPLQVIYFGSLNHDGQTIWDKNEVLLGTSFGNTLGTEQKPTNSTPPKNQMTRA